MFEFHGSVLLLLVLVVDTIFLPFLTGLFSVIPKLLINVKVHL
jgi:hypothetical protein